MREDNRLHGCLLFLVCMSVTKEKGLCFPCLHSDCFSKCAPCFCTVCVQSVHAFQRSNNVVVCAGVTLCLCEWVSWCTSRLSEIWTFPPALALLFCIAPPFLWHTLIIREIKGWEECWRRKHRWGVSSSSFPSVTELSDPSSLEHVAVLSQG